MTVGAPTEREVVGDHGIVAPDRIYRSAAQLVGQDRCPADNCPPDTLIGSSESDIDLLPNFGVVTTVAGRIYNQELLGDEAGRLGIIVDTLPTKTFLTAPFYVRSNGDYGLDGVLDDLPRTIAGFGNIQIKRLKFTLFGTANGRNFTRGPTNCSLHTSTTSQRGTSC